MKFDRSSIIAAMLLLLPAAAFGQRSSIIAPACCPTGQCPAPTQGWRPQLISPVRPRQPRQVGNPAIVRVGDQYGNGTSYGSGTIVDRRNGVAYVVTCWHTFRDSNGKGRPFVRAAGREYNAVLIHTDKLWDVAVLKIVDPKIKPLPLSDTAATRGQQIWLAGFGSGQYRHAAGQLAGFDAPDRDGSAFELMTVSTGARQGDSGGPMIGVRGGVVGVISATTGRSTYGCCLPRLRRILRAVLPPYPNRPGIALPKPRQVLPMEPEQKETPVLPYVAPANAALLKRLADLEREVQTLRKQVEACAGREGPQGKEGPRGLPGEVGPAPEVDLDALAAKLRAQMPAIDYQVLGKAIVSHLPPVKLQIEHPDGQVFEQAKPLGEPIRIKLVPKALTR